MLVFDPAHGGAQVRGNSTPSGRRGAAGLEEKAVTLRVCSGAAALLGGPVELTRSRDENRSLGERVEVARRARAQVFVSVHASGAAGPGPSVWIHSAAGPRSERLAQALAARLIGPEAPVHRAELAVLDPGWHAEQTAACLVDLADLEDPREERWLIEGGVATLAGRLAGALQAIASHAMEGRYEGRADEPRWGVGPQDFITMERNLEPSDSSEVLLKALQAFASINHTSLPAGDELTGLAKAMRSLVDKLRQKMERPPGTLSHLRPGAAAEARRKRVEDWTFATEVYRAFREAHKDRTSTAWWEEVKRVDPALGDYFNRPAAHRTDPSQMFAHLRTNPGIVRTLNDILQRLDDDPLVADSTLIEIVWKNRGLWLQTLGSSATGVFQNVPGHEGCVLKPVLFERGMEAAFQAVHHGDAKEKPRPMRQGIVGGTSAVNEHAAYVLDQELDRMIHLRLGDVAKARIVRFAGQECAEIQLYTAGRGTKFTNAQDTPPQHAYRYPNAVQRLLLFCAIAGQSDDTEAFVTSPQQGVVDLHAIDNALTFSDLMVGTNAPLTDTTEYGALAPELIPQASERLSGELHEALKNLKIEELADRVAEQCPRLSDGAILELLVRLVYIQDRLVTHGWSLQRLYKNMRQPRLLAACREVIQVGQIASALAGWDKVSGELRAAFAKKDRDNSWLT